MKSSTPLIIAALLVSLFTGCSKSSPPAKVAVAIPIVANLGVVEIADGTPSHHDLGNGRVCIISPTILKNGSVSLVISIDDTNAPEVSHIYATLPIESLPDRAVRVANGVIDISLTPHLKI